MDVDGLVETIVRLGIAHAAGQTDRARCTPHTGKAAAHDENICHSALRIIVVGRLDGCIHGTIQGPRKTRSPRTTTRAGLQHRCCEWIEFSRLAQTP